jgi:acetyltransferase-like isoleucine patch superfamily enzyme
MAVEKSAYERMLSGEAYGMPDWSLLSLQVEAFKKLDAFNRLANWEVEARQTMLKQMLGRIGDSYILSPVYWEYGIHIEIGDNCFFNFDCMFLDGARIRIGDRNAVGPRVQFLTASHPLHPRDRSRSDPQTGAFLGASNVNRPIAIGNDCWIGAGAIICPGVTIGEGTTIGAGSVVTRDIPAGVFAAGNPCRVIRPIEGIS